MRTLANTITISPLFSRSGKLETIEERTTLYEFRELDEKAQKKAIADLVFSGEWDDEARAQFDIGEREIWDCVRDLEASMRGARVKWNYNRFYSCDFDIEYKYDDCYQFDEVPEVDNNGVWASMDLCNAWNRHTKKLTAIAHRIDYINHLQDDVYPDWDYSKNDWIKYNAGFWGKLDEMRLQLLDLWTMELDKACQDVANTLQGLLQSEWDYLNSNEYIAEYLNDAAGGGDVWRTCDYQFWNNGGYTGKTYYSDTRKWYTQAGDLVEGLDIVHECVSIVKA